MKYYSNVQLLWNLGIKIEKILNQTRKNTRKFLDSRMHKLPKT